ncbi:MAG: hypothetical protein M4579_004741 [Chaenotheca gracillima]|nr:MAG: hypothetical protein M4579_004741 [Chaenotheca gracillima]
MVTDSVDLLSGPSTTPDSRLDSSCRADKKTFQTSSRPPPTISTPQRLRIQISGKELGQKHQSSNLYTPVEAMKALRRSMKGEKQEGKFHHQHHVSITPKDAIAILPPKKVIRALYDYEANPDHKQELSFARGDFFHVIGRENDQDWYEACNPSMPNARGLVPVSFFQILGRTERDSAGSAASGASNRLPDTDSGYSDRSQAGPAPAPAGPPAAESNARTQQQRIMSSIAKGSGAMVYGIVMFDFNAERPDELEAKEGEAIIVIAQSNPEWFVAKPIGRLGGPGLIPVSFIEIRDMSTGVAVPNAQEAVQRAGVPKVEEWKKMAADYKNSSISLGKFDSTSSQQMQQDMERMSMGNGGPAYQNGQPNGQYPQPMTQQHQRNGSRGGATSQSQYGRPPSTQLLAPISASIPRYRFANDKYWYIIRAVMEDGRHYELSRFYQDFYDFQIALLSQFQEEAGNTGRSRILPFMPGPVTYVTDTISSGRQQNLDEYIKKLLTMPPHISKCQLVRQLFAPKEGDYEVDPNATFEDSQRLSGASQPSSNESPEGDSRQSSRANLNGGGYQPGLSAPPPRSSHQRQQQSVSNGVAQAVHLRSASDLHPPGIDRQTSSLTQKSSGSQMASNSTGALKIKIYFQDDLIAIRVPSDIVFDQLKEKLQGRLGVGNDIVIQYKDEPSNSFREMRNDDDLDVALQRNPKLTLYVNY